ncbi:hypothetical protein LEMLEM_LOCUS17938 [Lemmus lemmus]
MEHHYKADVDCGLSYSECNMGNETGAPLFVGPGLRGPAKHCGRGHRCATRIQSRPTEQKDKVGVFFWPPNLECNVGNKSRTPLVIGPGLRGPANHRGRGHRCATRTQAREHSYALPAPGSEKRVHGALLKRRQVRQPSTTRVVAHKPLCQCKKSSAKARGHSVVGLGGSLGLMGGKGSMSKRSPKALSLFLCCPPAFSPAPYMTMTLVQQLIASPSMELHEAFALSNPCSDLTPLPCSSMEYHPVEPQVPAEKFGLWNVGQQELSGCVEQTA